MVADMTASTAERTTGWMADASTFGARLALIRQRMGWGNVEKAAKTCGISTETWRSWERDGREPHRITTIAKQIAGATGCDYLWLVHGPDRGEGGGPSTTHEYSAPIDPLAARVIRTVGESPLTASPTRPVRQTRPLRPPDRRDTPRDTPKTRPRSPIPV
jgi:hypothetical protein